MIKKFENFNEIDPLGEEDWGNNLLLLNDYHKTFVNMGFNPSEINITSNGEFFYFSIDNWENKIWTLYVAHIKKIDEFIMCGIINSRLERYVLSCFPDEEEIMRSIRNITKND